MWIKCWALSIVLLDSKCTLWWELPSCSCVAPHCNGKEHYWVNQLFDRYWKPITSPLSSPCRQYELFSCERLYCRVEWVEWKNACRNGALTWTWIQPSLDFDAIRQPPNTFSSLLFLNYSILSFLTNQNIIRQNVSSGKLLILILILALMRYNESMSRPMTAIPFIDRKSQCLFTLSCFSNRPFLSVLSISVQNGSHWCPRQGRDHS